MAACRAALYAFGAVAAIKSQVYRPQNLSLTLSLTLTLTLSLTLNLLNLTLSLKLTTVLTRPLNYPKWRHSSRDNLTNELSD